MKTKEIKAVLGLLEGTDVRELEYEDESLRIVVRRGIDIPSVAAMERGLVTGQSLATTGPYFSWEVQEATLPTPGYRVYLSVDAELWADGGLVASGAGWHRVSAERWLVVVLRGEDWAVSSPHWLDF